ncbi:MAG: triose-phosphate isomerase [Pseudomonadota bacterium]
MTDKNRKPIMAANWKMNNDIAESLKFIAEFNHELKATGDTEVIICPPFTSLYSVGVALSELPYMLGGQNIHWEDNGAFTGEISGLFLKEAGCQFVIIGHSERRNIFHEDDECLKDKVRTAQHNELIPIFCVGEKLDEREASKTWDVIEHQLRIGLSSYSPKLTNLVVAYEPIWAIGTGRTATPEQAEEVHALIREWLSTAFDRELSDKTQILYGGSVKPSNSRDLIKKPNIDGFLVGGASLDSKQFADIVRSSF